MHGITGVWALTGDTTAPGSTAQSRGHQMQHGRAHPSTDYKAGLPRVSRRVGALLLHHPALNIGTGARKACHLLVFPHSGQQMELCALTHHLLCFQKHPKSAISEPSPSIDRGPDEAGTAPIRPPAGIDTLQKTSAA